jgi:hypothetical protein
LPEERNGFRLCAKAIAGHFGNIPYLDGIGICRQFAEGVFVRCIVSHGKDKVVCVVLQNSPCFGSLAEVGRFDLQYFITLHDLQVQPGTGGDEFVDELLFAQGNKILEIKSTHFSKGSEARRILQNNTYDFILAMGDDTTDEDTFRELPADAYTIKVGNISEVARYCLCTQAETIPFLRQLMDPLKV